MMKGLGVKLHLCSFLLQEEYFSGLFCRITANTTSSLLLRGRYPFGKLTIPHMVLDRFIVDFNF